MAIQDPALNGVWDIMTQSWGSDGLGDDSILSDDADGEEPDYPASQQLAIEDGVEDGSESEDVPTTQPEQTAESEYDPYADRVGSDVGDGDEVGKMVEPSSQLDDPEDSQVVHTPKDDGSEHLSPFHDISGSDVAAMEGLFPKPAPAEQPLGSQGPDKSFQDAMPPPPALTPAQREEKLERLRAIRRHGWTWVSFGIVSFHLSFLCRIPFTPPYTSFFDGFKLYLIFGSEGEADL